MLVAIWSSTVPVCVCVCVCVQADDDAMDTDTGGPEDEPAEGRDVVGTETQIEQILQPTQAEAQADGGWVGTLRMAATTRRLHKFWVTTQAKAQAHLSSHYAGHVSFV